MAKVGQGAVAGIPAVPKPLLTAQCGTQSNGSPVYCNGVGPYDFATIYNVLPLWNAPSPIDGTGQSIALIGRSNINPQDVSDFRNLFGLSPNPPQILLDGPDPGLVPGDETEADLDVEWSGAVAKGATIKLIVSESTETTDGVDLSAEYAVDNLTAPVLSESFGDCEFFMGAASNQFYKNLWQQAAAEGISVFVSSGDQGSAGCDFFQGVTPQPARNGLQVSGIASTPYNVAVGGTDFNDFSNPLTYWNLTNNPTTQESAKGYIPETTWNDACTNAVWAQVGFTTNAESNCNNPRLSGDVVTIAGSGGKSGCINSTGSTVASCSGAYAKPAWQTGPGVPSDGVRDLPDVSLFSSDGFVGNFYMICEADVMPQPCNPSNPFNIVGIGGTSASSPAFAGLMALVDQETGARQGNPNFILYKLAAKQSPSSCNSSTVPASTCVFNDVTSGTIAMPCASGSLNCTTSTFGDQFGVLSGYSTGAGYDLATGLGSVNAADMVNNWNTVTFTPSATTLTLNGGSAVNVTHGSPVNVAVSVSPISPHPTGDVSLIATQGANTFGFDTMTLSGGTASGTTSMLPGGTSYAVKAHYEGDGTYGGSDSSPVTVTINPEASKTFPNLVTLDVTGRPTSFSASNATYGAGFFQFRVDVGNSNATMSPTIGISSTCSNHATNCPTGMVSLSNNGMPFAGGNLLLNVEGYAEDHSLTPGTYAISANYSGDSSYGPSTASASFTIAKAPTTASAAVAGLPVQYGNNEEITGTVLTVSNGVAPSGTLSFSLDGTPLTTTALAYEGFAYNPHGSPPYATFDGSGLATFLALGNHNLTVQYSGDGNYAAATSAPTVITVIQAQPFFTTYGATPSSVNINQQVTLTAQMFGSDAGVAPTGTMTFYINGAAMTGTVTYTPLAHGLQASLPYIPATFGNQSITASYSGDSNYLTATTPTAATLTVLPPDFSVSASTTPLTITAGQSGSATLTITPLTSYTSTVNLSCPAGAIIPGSTCTVSPPSVTLSNNTPAMATLTISILAPSSTTSAVTAPARLDASRTIPPTRDICWTLSLMAALAVVFLLALPSRHRSFRIVLGLGLACLASLAVGCGGGHSGPALTTTTLSVPSTKVSQNSSLQLTARITSQKAATGAVTFASTNCFFNTFANVSNGVAQLVINSLQFAPGTCTFNAQYGGDANNLPSQSGILNIAFMGTTTQQVFAQTSTLNHVTSVSVTIQ